MGLLHQCRTAWSRHHRSAGFGIHSPHAFRFVTEVLGNRSHFYAYSDIEQMRREVIAATGSKWPHAKVMTFRQAKMLFRITNHFNPTCLLQVGVTDAIDTATMLAVSTGSQLWLHEPSLDSNPAAKQVITPLTDRVTHSSDLQTVLGGYLAAHGDEPPFVLINHIGSEADAQMLATILTPLLTSQAVVLMRHMANDERVRALWDTCCQALGNGQTFTNERRGILIANPKLQREHFDIWL